MPDQIPAGETREGRIITFYSYKGGTGRSMALANVSWLLALSGLKVLVIDWDLEAPGLHRYFRPFLEDPDLAESDGLIDFVTDFVQAASEQTGETTDGNWYKPYSNLLPYAKEVKYGFPGEGLLDLIPAGRQNDTYAARVNSFNWKHFYERLNGELVLEEVRRILKESKVYDYILIDSRTGVSDTSGICTVQMPDDLVVAFTLNLQSVIGASRAAASVIAQRSLRKRSIRAFPVAMRVEAGEFLKTAKMKDFARPRFLSLLPPEMPAEEKEKYWGETEVPYIPFYAFEENLAYFRDAANDPKSVLSAMTRIANRLLPSPLGDLPPLDPGVKTRTIAAYDAFAGSPQAQSAKAAVYVSADSDAAVRLQSDLEKSGFDLLTRDRYEKAGEAVFLVAIGQAGLTRPQTAELALAERSRKGPIYTVLLPGALPEALPRLLLPYGVIDLRAGARLTELPDPAAKLARLPLTPYPGLNPFTADDVPMFVARGPLTEKLVHAVNRSRAVALIGPPGSGRKSVVQAGLIPRLIATPGQAWEIFYALPSSWSDTARVLVVMDATALAGAGATSIPIDACVLVIAEGPWQVVLIARQLGITPLQIEIPPLSDAELVAAITEPAARAGLDIEGGLATRIVADLKNEKVQLPLLQFVMSELYDSDPPGRLTLAKYQAMGGADMVERKCEGVFNRFDSGLGSLTRLILVEDGGGMQPQAAPEENIRSEDSALLDAFVSAGIVVREAGTVRFSNRIFLDRWPRLRRWVEDNRIFLLWRQRLDQSLAAWQSNPRPFTLLSGTALAEAQRQASERPGDLNVRELDYIASSAKNAEADAVRERNSPKRLQNKIAAWIGAVVLVLMVAAYFFFPYDQGFPTRAWCYQKAIPQPDLHSYEAHCFDVPQACAYCVLVPKMDLKTWGGVQPTRNADGSWGRTDLFQPLPAPFPAPVQTHPLQNQKKN